MSRSRRRIQPTDEPASGCTVSICRGGECGSRTKHPGTDHREQLAQIKSQLDGHTLVKVTKCLDACEHSNVVVVTPSTEAANDGAGDAWFGEMNDDAVTTELISWVNAGGPGRAEMPLGIELTSFSPSRRMRHALDE